MAAPWPGLQFANGTFPDYLHHDEAPASTRYGEAMLGYGLLMTGVREDDDALIDAGLRGVTWFVGQADLQRDHPSVFANAAVASAYNFARAHVAGRPQFDDHRADWEQWLQRAKLLWLPDTAHYANKYLVEVIAVLELVASGLDSAVSGSVLAHEATARGLAEDLVNVRVPALADAGAFAVGDKRAYFLSDPEGGNPLAYQALSLGMYGRAVVLAGRPGHGRGQGHAAAGRAVDVGADGARRRRGLPRTLAGAGLDARADRRRRRRRRWLCADASAARYRPVGQRALVRLRDAYGTGAKGLYLTPSLREDLRDRLPRRRHLRRRRGLQRPDAVACNWATDLRDDDGAPRRRATAPTATVRAAAVQDRVRRRAPRRPVVRRPRGGQDRGRRPALRLRPRGAQGARRGRRLGRRRAAAAAHAHRARQRRAGAAALGRRRVARGRGGSTSPPTARSPSPAGSAPRRGSGCGAACASASSPTRAACG